MTQAEIQEASLDSSNVCMASLERELRLLVKEVDVLRETAERVKGLEKDNRDLRQRAAMDHRTLATLREVRTAWGQPWGRDPRWVHLKCLVIF